MTPRATGLTIVRMMNIRAALLAALVGGCSLYNDGDDDAPIDIDAGAPSTIAGTYSLTWECVSSACESPIAASPGAAVQAIVSDGFPAAIEWVKNGQPAPAFTHTGRMLNECVAIGAGMDGVFQRDAYELCAVASSMTWTTPTGERSTWRLMIARQ